MKMIGLRPLTTYDFVGNTATNTYSDHSSVTTYASGNHVEYVGYTYQSLQNGNLNKVPANEPTWWAVVGPSNKWACIDPSISTQTVTGNAFSVTFAAENIDSVVVMNVSADSTQVIVRSGLGGTIIYDQTKTFFNENSDAWDALFTITPANLVTQAAFLGIPVDADAYVTITFSSTYTSRVGLILVGRAVDIGYSLYGASAGITDYSVLTFDEFGETASYTPRGFSKGGTFPISIVNTSYNYVMWLMSRMRSQIAVWVAAPDATQFQEGMIIYGRYKELRLVTSYLTHSHYELEIEGTT